MMADEYGDSTICNLYFDTPDYLLIRRSLDHPVYKEKLRLRSYGKAENDSPVFLEIKKKYQSVVYKRRICLPETAAVSYLNGESDAPDTQIGREIDYFLHHYSGISPKVFISYDRQAFYSKSDCNFRITFDRNICWRSTDLSLCSEIYGTPVLPPDHILMEVKTAAAIPLWLTGFLSGNRICKTSFSKYGTVYQKIFSTTHTTGGKYYV